MHQVYVVGEIGPNFVYGNSHRINEQTLVRLIDVIADSGADCAKVQIKGLGKGSFYDGDDLSRDPHDPQRSPFTTRGEYVAMREPRHVMLGIIKDECAARGLDWSASPWDVESLELLMAFDPPWIKVASASITNHALLRAIARTHKPVVMSTGMSTVQEIDDAVECMDTPLLTLAVCTASYPASVDTLNLSRIREMRKRYNVEVGWSSHSPDPDHAALAVAAGATWIEQHVTTGKLRWGPDHPTSLSPQEFHECVWRVREAERAMGAPTLGVLPCETEARARLRRTP